MRLLSDVDGLALLYSFQSIDSGMKMLGRRYWIEKIVGNFEDSYRRGRKHKMAVKRQNYIGL